MASDISKIDGFKITAVAKLWKGTPYKAVGAASSKGSEGDCSGTTWRIYDEAGYTFTYQATSTFLDYVAKTKRFREVGKGNPMQEGDVLYWPGHVAIFSSFTGDEAHATTKRLAKDGKTPWTQVNDMWSATRPGGADYGPNKMSFFRKEAPRVFRYQR
jgi:hypothetical protein